MSSTFLCHATLKFSENIFQITHSFCIEYIWIGKRLKIPGQMFDKFCEEKLRKLAQDFSTSFDYKKIPTESLGLILE